MEIDPHVNEHFYTTNSTYGNWKGSPSQVLTTFTKAGLQAPSSYTHIPTRGPLTNIGTKLHPNAESVPFPMSNIEVRNDFIKGHGALTNTGTDLYSDVQGLWSNSNFNSPHAKLDRGEYTYSNLQGAWARVGPDIYRSTHPGWSYNRWEDPPSRTIPQKFQDRDFKPHGSTIQSHRDTQPDPRMMNSNTRGVIGTARGSMQFPKAPMSQEEVFKLRRSHHVYGYMTHDDWY
ncbi:unnamed protein product [Owenia fusiformis]|uniref:Uncharacterized protein n=1 Tax=Owenia fusiformis TaxID=6347 RepID=A0A8J1UF08_OWEFU|nr:unnamed protein product [Owenia fusiformis]